MNSYDLSRIFWDWAFDNPEKVSPNHVAIFFFAVEHCNRLGWKDKFGFPSQMTMDAIGIKKHSTYIRYFDDLVEFGFFKLIQKSRNQYSSNIISLTCAIPKNGKALGKAISKHGEKQTESMGLGMGISTGSIDKQIPNQEQEKPSKPKKQSAILFSESKYHNNPTLFKSEFGDKYQNIDLDYYFDAVSDWSASNGEKKIDWIATARNFIRKDGNNARKLTQHKQTSQADAYS